MIDRQINMINRQDRWTRQIDMIDEYGGYDKCMDEMIDRYDRQI